MRSRNNKHSNPIRHFASWDQAELGNSQPTRRRLRLISRNAETHVFTACPDGQRFCQSSSAACRNQLNPPPIRREMTPDELRRAGLVATHPLHAWGHARQAFPSPLRPALPLFIMRDDNPHEMQGHRCVDLQPDTVEPGILRRSSCSIARGVTPLADNRIRYAEDTSSAGAPPSEGGDIDARTTASAVSFDEDFRARIYSSTGLVDFACGLTFERESLDAIIFLQPQPCSGQSLNRTLCLPGSRR